MLDLGLLLIRLVIGLSFVGHGAQKLFGFSSGAGLKGTGAFFDSLGIKPGVTMALLAGLSEFLGGLLFAIGLFTPFAGIVIAGTMVAGILTVTGKKGFWAMQGGYEYGLTILVIAIAIALTGAGHYSLDAILF